MTKVKPKLYYKKNCFISQDLLKLLQREDVLKDFDVFTVEKNYINYENVNNYPMIYIPYESKTVMGYSLYSWIYEYILETKYSKKEKVDNYKDIIICFKEEEKINLKEIDNLKKENEKLRKEKLCLQNSLLDIEYNYSELFEKYSQLDKKVLNEDKVEELLDEQINELETLIIKNNNEIKTYIDSKFDNYESNRSDEYVLNNVPNDVSNDVSNDIPSDNSDCEYSSDFEDDENNYMVQKNDLDEITDNYTKEETTNNDMVEGSVEEMKNKDIIEIAL